MVFKKIGWTVAPWARVMATNEPEVVEEDEEATTMEPVAASQRLPSARRLATESFPVLSPVVAADEAAHVAATAEGNVAVAATFDANVDVVATPS